MQLVNVVGEFAVDVFHETPTVHVAVDVPDPERSFSVRRVLFVDDVAVKQHLRPSLAKHNVSLVYVIG